MSRGSITLNCLLLIFVVSCGKKGTSSVSTYESRYDFQSEQTIDKIVEEYKLQAPSNQGSLGIHIEKMVGIVGKKSPGNYFQCSGFLVGPDLVATNAHCVDFYDSCQNDSGYILNIDHKKVVAHCKELIETREVKNGADFALVRIDKKFSHWFEVDTKDLPNLDSEQITTMVVDPTDDGGVIRIKNCQISDNSILSLLSRFANDFSQVIVGCHVVHGNSGSPVLKNDKVVGLVYATFEKESSLFLQFKVKSLHTNVSSLDFMVPMQLLTINDQGLLTAKSSKKWAHPANINGTGQSEIGRDITNHALKNWPMINDVIKNDLNKNKVVGDGIDFQWGHKVFEIYNDQFSTISDFMKRDVVQWPKCLNRKSNKTLWKIKNTLNAGNIEFQYLNSNWILEDLGAIYSKKVKSSMTIESLQGDIYKVTWKLNEIGAKELTYRTVIPLCE